MIETANIDQNLLIYSSYLFSSVTKLLDMTIAAFKTTDTTASSASNIF